MEDNLEVYFCDLCNTSVPLPDLETGEAMRVRGKVLGKCCVNEVRRPAVVGLTVPRANRGGAGVAGVGVVLLAAVAGATLFLDWRMSTELNRTRDSQTGLSAMLAESQGRLRTVEERLDGMLSASDLVVVRESVAAMGEELQHSEARVRAAVQGVDGRVLGLANAVTGLEEAQRAQSSGLIEIRAGFERIGDEVAALAARPSPVPAQGRPIDAEESAVPAAHGGMVGLSAELAHNVAKLSDADPGIRFEAVDKLVASKDARILPQLTSMMKDPDPFVRRLTVEGLSEFKVRGAVDALLDALSDEEVIVRHSAYESLRSLTGQDIAFDPEGRKEDMRNAERRWRDWWSKSRDSFPE